MHKIALPFVACLLTLAVAGAHAQSLWKWRDASGQLHIGDTPPPPGTPAKNILSTPAGGVLPPPAMSTPAPAPDASGASADSALDSRKKAADKDKADKAKADRAAIEAKNAVIRKDNCARAHAQLSSLQSGQRIARINAQGEREVLDDAGRANELQRTQDVIANNCGAAPVAP